MPDDIYSGMPWLRSIFQNAPMPWFQARQGTWFGQNVLGIPALQPQQVSGTVFARLTPQEQMMLRGLVQAMGMHWPTFLELMQRSWLPAGAPPLTRWAG